MVFGRHPRRTLVRLLILVLATTVLFKFIILPIQVSGLSMMPTYQNGKVNFVNQLAYTWHKPQRGDVVAIRMPSERDMLLKRIVGLPGERIALIRGDVYVNGRKLEEPYMKKKRGLSNREIVVEEDHYFVIGDNRDVSVFLQAPAWNIVGKAIF
jgi:signal peptidase I